LLCPDFFSVDRWYAPIAGRYDEHEVMTWKRWPRGMQPGPRGNNKTQYSTPSF
jgi:hypothetical protein